MNNIFESATLKLTGWYLLILMSVGLLFSLIIYQVSAAEVDSRFNAIEQRLERELGASSDMTGFVLLRTLQTRQAEANIFTNLVYMNALFLAVGGIASYFMARTALKPIEQAHEAQSRFTSDASHEFRTPLAAMRTELEVALRDPKISKNEMKELLGSTLEEVDKLSKISHTLLILSRLDHSSILETRRVAVDDIARRVTQSKPRIVYRPPDKPLYIAANQVSIEELISILVDNALKYSPPKSKVDFTLRRKGKKAVLQVTNSGKGISATELPYIFERFYRADESRSKSELAGFGLGLALAKRIVEVHKGDLSVSSEPGKKTSFIISLPLHESAPKRKRALQK